MMFAVAQQKLHIHGRKMSAPVPTFAFLYVHDSGIDKKAGLKAFFDDKIPEILLNLNELTDALNLFRKKKKNAEGKALYEKIIQAMDKKINFLNKLIIINPIKAFRELKKYQKVMAKEPTLNKKIKSILSDHDSPIIARFLHIEKEHEKILNIDDNSKKSLYLKRIQQKYESLLEKRQITPELRFEIRAYVKSIQPSP